LDFPAWNIIWVVVPVENDGVSIGIVIIGVICIIVVIIIGDWWLLLWMFVPNFGVGA